MRKIVLFIAMSIDGYIADVTGGVDWLMGETSSQDDMQSYQTFIQDVDCVLMGWNTYHQIANELSPDEWYYKGLTTYVFTHRDVTSSEEIIFVQETPSVFISRLKQTKGKNIWICGGANLVHQLIQDQLIDRFHISIIPTILGDGIRLFQTQKDKINLKLVGTSSYNGITDVIYEKR